ncbi:MAG: UDP-2,3-diacylglucosamine diphosphatase, partial [Bacteroidetes bacterium]|nr:UDP-2,3-diacylglucosamine diphosphatase [Bacteroidota bacterium]
IKDDAERIFLMGDVFDFWFEYKHVVPKYYVRLLGKLAELSDSGIQIDFFTGNHDMWAFDYLTREIGIPVHRKPLQLTIQGKQFYIGHGDGLGPGDYGYKFIKKVFANPVCQWLFARLHPNFGIGMANFWSRKSRSANPAVEKFESEQNEWLLTWCREYISASPEINFFVFGHRHLPLNLEVVPGTRYFNLGDWFTWCSYLRVENGVPELLYFRNENSEPVK